MTNPKCVGKNNTLTMCLKFFMKKINFKMNPDTDKRLGQNDADPL